MPGGLFGWWHRGGDDGRVRFGGGAVAVAAAAAAANASDGVEIM